MTKRTRKKTPQKRKKPAQKKRPFQWWWVLLVVGVLVALGLFFTPSTKTPVPPPVKEESQTNDALMQKMKTMLEGERKRLSEKAILPLEPSPRRTQALPPEPENVAPEKMAEAPSEVPVAQKPSEALDYEKSLENSAKTIDFRKKEPVIFSGKPKLVIIIDDVSFPHHVKKIKAIPYKITPSILPPTARHPNSHALASEFSFYMVHLPMEALSHNSPEERTLNVSNTKTEMAAWIQELKQLFPKATYYNNHTGSKFTANLEAMDHLIQVFQQEKLTFLDSRTTPDSKALELSEKYGMEIDSRDVFLDNTYEAEAIRTQLKEAVRIAKRNGRAIAIGHPHANTLSVLAQAKDILRDVDVVYPGEW